MSSADRVAHIDGQTHNHAATHICLRWQHKVNKTEQSIYECLLGFCFNNISAPPQILAASTVFFSPNSRNEEMMGDGFLGATAAGLRTVKRLLSTSCNKQGQRSSE